MTRCGHHWLAPLLVQGGSTQYQEQECALPKGHEGDHRSWSKVTAPQPPPGYTWSAGRPRAWTG